MNISEQTIIDIFYFFTHEVFQCMSYYIILMLMLTPKYNKTAMLIIMTAISVTCNYISRTRLRRLVFFSLWR